MTYELAKELKDAGWPILNKRKRQNFLWVLSKKGWNKHYGRTQKQVTQMELLGCEVLPCPTLSELIEACGERFVQLEVLHDQNKWIASNGEYEGSSSRIDAEGTTPEEAVARLWLALNKHE